MRDGNIGGILSRTTAAGATFYGYDGNGNVTLLTDSAGTDVGHYRYDAFGNTLEAVGARAGENPYRFSTKELHAASGLYDFGLRFYSPGMGRWMNRDPLEEEGGVNLYAMIGNDPVNDVDEYGLAPNEDDPCMHDGIPDSCGPGKGHDPYVRVWQDDIIDRGKDIAVEGAIGAVISAIPFLRGKGKSAPVRPPIRAAQMPKARAIIQAARVYKANGPIGAKATNILKGRLPRWALTKQERQIAARFYTKTARRASVAKQPMAREYNLARAKYLLQGGRISDTLQKFKDRGF